MSKLLPKTHAKTVFCLTDKELEALPAVEKRNPRSRNGPPMKLYDKAQLEVAAHRKWGGPEGLAAEQRKREDRRAARAATAATAAAAAVAATAAGGAAAAAAGAGSPGPAAPTGGLTAAAALSWLGLPPLVSERIRQVLPLERGCGQPTPTTVRSPTAVAGPARTAWVTDRGGTGAEAGGAGDGAGAHSGLTQLQAPGQGQRQGRGRGDVEMVDLAASTSSSCPSSEEEGVEVAEVVSGGEEGVETGLGGAAAAHQQRQQWWQRPRQPLRQQQPPERPEGQERGEDADDAIVITSSSSSSASDDDDDDDDGDNIRVGKEGSANARPSGGRGAAAAAAVGGGGCSGGGCSGGGGVPAVAAGEYVLYWMKTAVRGHENPALDAARAAAERLHLPLRVAAFVLPSCQPYVNHRRVKFLLEGLRDAQRELRQHGLDLLVHVYGNTPPPPRSDSAAPSCGGGGVLARVDVSGPGWEALLAAARRAALVVTEDMPVDPDAAWLAALVRQLELDSGADSAGSGGGSGGGGGGERFSPQETPAATVTTATATTAIAASPPLPRHRPGVWAVDTACIVPMQLVGRAYDKAYAYRSATEGLRRQRLRAVYSPSVAAVASAAATAADAAAAAAGEGGGAAVAATTTAVTAAAAGGAPRGPLDLFLRTNRSTAPCQSQNGDGAAATQRGRGTASMSIDEDLRREVASTRGTAGDGDGSGSGRCPLGWPSLDLQRPDLDLGALAASLRGVDCSVAGVAHLVGGSTAGYGRWDAWRRRGGVARYAATRNDAMQRSGTSRMSPYLRWGMVSPFRIAREAAASGGSGAGKFLDELLVWRELSYSFCFHRYRQLHSVAVLPRWAQDSLAAHATDPRVTKTLQQLEAGTTGDRFWDAAQRQLAAHGELHNNVRMTWGKALLGWCASPQGALEATLHLNHRYALDGCDPASYGGVLWCFGLFDGPKEAPATLVSGALRRRPTGAHSRRLDPSAYAALPP
ncbi:hypothetical protein PLESTM_001820400 [Pleodorina starrii]|nr:hypothetical protein PLESTM_001820400 [Pleodorina starrii]